MTYSILPYNEVQKAVALSIADVSKKINSKKKLAEHAYARAFFFHFLGTRYPKKNELVRFVYNDEASKPEIISLVDELIRSNGYRAWGVFYEFKYEAFPSLLNMKDVRLESSCSMRIERDVRVENKIQTQYDDKVKERKRELLTLGNNDLGQWVSEYEYELDAMDLKTCLSVWYEENVVQECNFWLLYKGMDARAIAYDLSFDDVELIKKAG